MLQLATKNLFLLVKLRHRLNECSIACAEAASRARDSSTSEGVNGLTDAQFPELASGFL